MKNIELLYKTEEASTMMIYYYDVHAWRWDVKFWLVDGKWCCNLSGENAVGELTEAQVKTIHKFESIIAQHEKENQNFISFQNCRKRTCICKSCDKFCSCGNCNRKIINCDKRDK